MSPFGLVILFVTLLRVKCISAGSDEELIKAIETQAAQLPLDSFTNDPIFVQKVDTATKISQYRPIAGKEFIFSHKNDDTGKEVVVISGADDRLTVKKTKRLYIVFRKKDGENYFVTAALIRDALALDTEHPKIKVNGADKLIEWEMFSDHMTPSRNQLLLNAFFCVSTFLSPCSFNATVVTPTLAKSPPYIPKPVPAEADSVKIVTSDGSDADDNFDFYADLFSYTSSNNKGRYFGDPYGGGFGLGNPIGAVGGLVGGVLGAATGIVCGVLGAVFGGCGSAGYVDPYAGYPPPMMQQAVMPMQQGIQPGMPMPYPGQQVMGRKKRQAPDVSKDYSGWKTQYVSPKPGSTLAHENEIFFGFGNCPPPATPVDPKELESATTNDQIIDFYLKVLRSDCLSDRRAVMIKLLADGLLIIKGKALNINPASPKLALHKLNMKDTLELASAAELRAFTLMYGEEVTAPSALSKSPDGQKDISRSIHFVTNIILRFLKESRAYPPIRIHMIRLTRYLIILLKSIFAKVQQDQQILATCQDCLKDKEMNANDRLQVVGLLEFIKHGIAPVDKGEDPEKVFKDFFAKNLAALEKLVQFYS